jgi:hypothetical protein
MIHRKSVIGITLHPFLSKALGLADNLNAKPAPGKNRWCYDLERRKATCASQPWEIRRFSFAILINAPVNIARDNR